MTLLAIATEAAVSVAEATPQTVQDASPFTRAIVQFINETGRELARRVDWHSLRRTATVPGNGTTVTFPLSSDFARLSRGQCVSVGGLPIRGSLSSDEWGALTQSVGSPRYFFLSGQNIGFYPTAASGSIVNVIYQTKEWAENTASAGLEYMKDDGDRERLPTDLLVRGSVWRWLRHTGRDFSDHMSEYETMLADYAKAEGGVRQP